MNVKAIEHFSVLFHGNHLGNPVNHVMWFVEGWG